MCRPSPVEPMSSRTRTGVANTPMRLDAEALMIAPGTLPRAMEVKFTLDCTVEGTRHRKRMPW